MAGRPREFDPDVALDRAIDVFYEKGYESASLDDLTKAMGIKRPSLYKAFGNKEALFLTALRTYHQRNIDHIKAMLASDPNPIKGVEIALTDTAQYHIETKQGCLVANSANEARKGEGYDEIKAFLGERLQRSEDVFYEHLHAAQVAGYLPDDADPRELAQFLNGVIQGMAVVGRMNNNPTALMNMAQQAMCVIQQHETGSHS